MNKLFKKHQKYVISLVMTVIVTSCGGGSDLERKLFIPSDFINSTQSSLSDYGYIINKNTGTLSTLNFADFKILDYLDAVDKNQAFFVGGILNEIESILINDTEFLFITSTIDGSSYLFAVKVTPSVPPRYELIDIGLETLIVASKPEFFNKGNTSNPRLKDIKINSMDSKNTLWKLTYEKNSYRLESYPDYTETAVPITEEITENAQTSLSNLSFFVESGTAKTTKNDYFLFHSSQSKPLKFDSSIRNITSVGSFLYILTVDSTLQSKVSVYEFNGESLLLLGDVSFTEELQRINVITRNNRTLLIAPENTGTDSDGNGESDLFKIYIIDVTDNKLFTTNDISSFTVSTLVNFALYDSTADLLYLTDQKDGKITIINFETKEVQKTLDVYEPVSTLDVTYDPQALSHESLQERSTSTRGLMFAGLLSNNVRIIDTFDILNQNSVFIDASPSNQKVKSSANSVLFVNSGAESSPTLKNLQTDDSATKTEKWTITYEGVIPDSISSAGVLSGTSFTDTTKNFSTMKLKVKSTEPTFYDYIQSKDVNLSLVEIINNTTLTVEIPEGSTLEENTNLDYSIKAQKSYVVYGSKSGYQTNRALENQNYASDAHEISFKIFSSMLSQTTKDDFFSLNTTEAASDMLVGNNPTKIIFKSYEDKLYAYILNTESSSITVYNVTELKRYRTIF